MGKAVKVGFIAGVWDLLHEGHLAILRAIRAEVDRLVVIIHDDESCFKIKDKVPIQDLDHRVRSLEISGLADEIIVTRSTDPYKEFIQVVASYPNAEYYRGDDLTKDFPGQWLLEERGVKIHFLPYTRGVSSTQIRRTLWS